MEVWKEIPNATAYEVSNAGRIKSKKIRRYKGHMLKTFDNGSGYQFVYLYNGEYKKKYYIHRLVALCFIPNPYKKPCVNHIDNNPSNNKVENLEWCTKKENTDWMIKQGRAKRTKRWIENLHKSQRSTYKAVIGTNIETGETIYFEKMNDVKIMGFSAGNVCECCKNRMNTYKGYRWRYA